MVGLKKLMDKMAQAPALAKAGQAAPKSAPAKAADPLGGFIHQLKSGAIQSNLNKPALPYTARKSWSA